VKRAAFFGSIVRGELAEESDVDILMELTQKLSEGDLHILKIEQVVPGHIGPRSLSAPSASDESTSW
jgi:predicted nucleotidyltransferase